MSKNRTTTHRGKSGKANHNEHKFLDNERDVSGIIFCGKDGMTFEESEIDFYEQRYAKMLSEQNEKYIEKRNYSRCKSMKEFYNSKRYKPTEEILQYGHVGGEVPDRKTYEQMVDEYVRWEIEWSESHGNHLHILNYANHFDEATPHTHKREIWDYEEDGMIKLGQEKAMEQAGLKLPDPSKPVGRYNNRGMTWTAMCREKWQDICEEYGFEVEREPLPTKRKHKTVSEYQNEVNRKYFEGREQELNTRETSLNDRERALQELEHKNIAEDIKRRKWLEKREIEIENKVKTVTERESQVNKDARILSERIGEYERMLERMHASEEQKAKAMAVAERDRKYAQKTIDRTMAAASELGVVAGVSADTQFGE